MNIRKIDSSNSGDVTKFVMFPFDLYTKSDLWVPMLLGEQRDIVKGKHPFYDHSEAEFFVAERNGKVVGRIAVLENKNYNQYKKSQTAFFGYFEVADDEQVAHALLETAVSFAKSRHLNNIVGPRGVMGVDGSVLVKGFEHLPALGVPYNYPYYDTFLQSFGFQKEADLLSGRFSVPYEMDARLTRIADRMRKRGSFTLKAFASKKEAMSWIPKMRATHREAFQSTRSFYPPTEAEMQAVIDTVLTIADPSLVKLVMKGDEIAGFILAFRNLSRGLQKANGRLFPFGWYHILRQKQSSPWMNVNAIGVLPKYQGLGANMLLYDEFVRIANDGTFKNVEVIHIDSENKQSRHDLEQLGVEWHKCHRHYRMEL